MFWSSKNKANDTFTDPRDGKVYKTVRIGDQIWMAENLAFDAPGSKCYKNDPANCSKYGRLYDWETAMKACPEGWRLPFYGELREFNKFVENNAKDFLGKKIGPDDSLRASSGWKNNSGKDVFGFAALPGGIAELDDNFQMQYKGAGEDGYWWSCSERYDVWSGATGTFHYLHLTSGRGYFSFYNAINPKYFCSVRCLKYPEPICGTYTDPRDGLVYRTVKIGEQVWMAEDLAFNAPGSEYNPASGGRLYDWNTAMEVAPPGWHLPSMEEWGKLKMFLHYEDGSYITDNGQKLRSKNGWRYFDDDSLGRDAYGFSALPMDSDKEGVYFWSSLEIDKDNVHTPQLDYLISSFNFNSREKNNKCCIRCIMDDPSQFKHTQGFGTPNKRPKPSTTSTSSNTTNSGDITSGITKDEVMGMFGDIFEGLGSPISDKKPAGKGNCPKCSGTGQIRVKMEGLLGEFMRDKTCPDCNGTGNIKG